MGRSAKKIALGAVDLRSADHLVQQCPDAMLCADQQGYISFWNAAAEALFGLPASSAIGQSLDIIVPQPMRGAHAAGMRRILAGGGPRIVGSIMEVLAQHPISGRQFAIEMSLSMWTHAGEQHFGAVIRDVSARRRNEDRLHQLAHFDQLTLLPNRTLLLDRLDAALARTDEMGVALLMIDLDKFKDINDCHGHATGDEVLKSFAFRFHEEITCRVAQSQQMSGAEITFARFGGDEFAAVIVGVVDTDQVLALAEEVRAKVAETIRVNSLSLLLTNSIGIALAPHHGKTSAELLANADLALYRAKLSGRDKTIMFEPIMRLAVIKHRAEEADVRRGWRAGEFEIFFQPQVNLVEREIIGAEALLRWRHPDKGLLSPDNFLPALERTELSRSVGDWVMADACRRASQWRRYQPAFRIGVNLFSSQIEDPELYLTVMDTLSVSALPADALEIEITETAVLHEDEIWIEKLKALRAAGVGLAFDDYGTGYASLSLLKRYPISRLKIDKSFVLESGNDNGNISIIRAIVSFGKTFGLDVIAEGIETIQQQEFLLSLGCRQGQGYLYGQPMPADAFAEKLRTSMNVGIASGRLRL
jgi:diguanylate cyclase (GGDEF)-like protein/PAS domain S-box-containing protein